MRFVNQYLNYSLFFRFFQSPLVLLGSVLGIRYVFILSFLTVFLTIDLIFVSVNLKKIKLNTVELSLVILVLFSAIFGIINNEISRRYINDLLYPLFFVSKITIFRYFFLREGSTKFILKFLKKYALWMLMSSILLIIFFFIALLIKPMYAGLSPEIHPFLSTSLVTSSYLGVFLVLIIYIMSGKRAMLMAALGMFFYYWGIIRKKIALFILLITIIIAVIIYVIQASLIDLSALNKYVWTFQKLQKYGISNMEILDQIGGGRFGEITSILNSMNWWDYIFGKGIGFTYLLESTGYGKVEEHANAHFSPISIISKYGVLFFLFLSFYFISCFKRFKSIMKNSLCDKITQQVAQISILILTALLIDFLFSYGVFTNFTLPIVIGFLQAKRKIYNARVKCA